jgi:hypothetical protein
VIAIHELFERKNSMRIAMNNDDHAIVANICAMVMPETWIG